MDSRLSRRAIASVAIGAACAMKTAGTFAQDVGTPSPPNATLPGTPAGIQLQWIIDVINSVEPLPTTAQIADHFAAGFLSQVPASQILDIFKQFQLQLAPVKLVELIGIATPLAIDAVINGNANTNLIASLTVDEQAPNKITGLTFTPYSDATPEIEPIANWEDLEQLFAAAGSLYSIHAAEYLGNGDIAVLHNANPEALLAIGSAFKLYVLGAIATGIDQGELAWDQQVIVTDDVKSFPSGVTQNEASGTPLSIDELCRRMISISDNTAADMLIGAATREACETALATQGNSDPERTMPFLTTRELFTIKLTDDQSLRDAYIHADVDERRALLVHVDSLGLPPIANAVSWTTPIAVDSIEWFATMSDLGSAINWLWEKGGESGFEPVRSILTINPGVPYDTSVWTSVAFKGGSEVGVVAFSWLLERQDGRIFTLSCGVNNREAPVPDTQLALAAAGAFPLLAAVP